MLKLIIIFVFAFKLVINSSDFNETNTITECKLAPLGAEEPICLLSKNISTTFLSSSKYRLPIEIHNGLVIWPNKYQPVSTRWSQLCPSPYLIKSTKTSNNKCLNAATCDQDSYCTIAYELNSHIKLVDNIQPINDDGPIFTDDLKSLNVTFDLEDNNNELILIDSTNKLDMLRSKLYRTQNEFKIEVSDQILDGCELGGIDLFTIRYDSNEERLYLKLKNRNDLKASKCFTFNLSVQRAHVKTSSISFVQVNLIDNRLDKPIFDNQVYNFTISENSPIDTLIGKVHAKYVSAIQMKQNKNQIKYRIVPLMDKDNDLDLVPVKIGQSNGNLSLKLNLDREKYLDKNEKSNDGILRLSIESSFASIKYAYCKVNIMIEDINDNQPIAKLSPLANFGVKPKRFLNNNNNSLNSSMQLYISENTPVNQILAYLAVYDPDSGENGTIKSIDLTLVNYKQPSKQTLKERALKLKQLKYAPEEHSQILPQVPFRLNKIGEKMYTVQLVSPLDFKQIESYSIEMRIQDNGTRPQLESKTIMQINVIDQNDYPPMFTHDRLIDVIVPENNIDNSVVYNLNAIDLDDNKNGQVRYKIINNPYLNKFKGMSLKDIEFEAKKRLDTTFDLNSQTGVLRLLRPLDRDNDIDGEHLDLIIMAIDNYDSESDQLNYDYITDEMDSQFGSTKSLNSTCMIRIKITDKNNNKPIFESSKLALNMIKFNEKTGFKQLGSVVVSDLDSLETNSKNYIKNETATKQSLFVFRDKQCQRAFDFSMTNTNDLETTFLFLIESIGNANTHIKCKLSVWIDLKQIENLKQFNNLIDFLINVKDNGDILTKIDELSSTLLVRIHLNQNDAETNGEQTLFELNTRIANISESIKIKSVYKLNEQLNQFEIDNFGQIINNTLLTISSEIETGLYLIDLISNDFRQKQIKINLYITETERQINRNILKHFDQQTFSILNKRNEKDESSLFQFENILMNSTNLLGSNFTFFFSNQTSNVFSQFVILISVILLFLILIFSCCICLIIKRKCINQSKKRNINSLNFIKNNLNVMDDDDNGGFKQKNKKLQSNHSIVVIEDLKTYLTDESNTKVNRYLEGLDTSVLQLNSNKYSPIQQANQQSSPVSISTSESSKNQISTSTDSMKSTTIDENNSGNKCTLSTTSSSCMSSDEGCYGSSDFSSEINLKLKKQQQQQITNNKSNLITPIKQQQNYYINNLTRFEKIYNNIDSLLESPVTSEINTTNTDQVIHSISGSYV